MRRIPGPHKSGHSDKVSYIEPQVAPSVRGYERNEQKCIGRIGG